MTALKEIQKQKCETPGCKEQAFAIINTKFLCKFHFREAKPQNERAGYRDHWKERKARREQWDKSKREYYALHKAKKRKLKSENSI